MIFSFIVLELGSCLLIQALGAEYSDLNGGARLLINGSQLVSIKEAPYVVALVKNFTIETSPDFDSNSTSNILHSEPTVFCTGSIITPEWVITAFHCLKKLDPELSLMNLGQASLSSLGFAVIAGCDTAAALIGNETNGNNSLRQVRIPIEAKGHPHLDWYESQAPGALPTPIPNTFDVMLIKVGSFTFGDSVDKIPLWAMTWEGSNEDINKKSVRALWMSCIGYGWGETGPNKNSFSLRAAPFTVMQGEGACECMTNDRNIICTTDEFNGSSICPGDGGGPLVCHNHLAGIAYSIYRCHGRENFIERPPLQCGADNVISSWIYVCPMLHWINRIVSGAPRPPPFCDRSSIDCGPSHLLATYLLPYCLFLIVFDI